MSKFIVGQKHNPLAQIVTSAVKKGLQPLIDDIDNLQRHQKANGQMPAHDLTIKQKMGVNKFLHFDEEAVRLESNERAAHARAQYEQAVLDNQDVIVIDADSILDNLGGDAA